MGKTLTYSKQLMNARKIKEKQLLQLKIHIWCFGFRVRGWADGKYEPYRVHQPTEEK